MLRNHCDGCEIIINLDEGYFTVEVLFQKNNDVEFASKEKPEKIRDLCYSCMAKVRPGIDAVDGKTDQ